MPVIIGLVLFSQTFWSPVDKALTLVMNFNSRYNEFSADRYARDLDYAEPLASGLIKISIGTFLILMLFCTIILCWHYVLSFICIIYLVHFYYYLQSYYNIIIMG